MTPKLYRTKFDPNGAKMAIFYATNKSQKCPAAEGSASTLVCDKCKSHQFDQQAAQ